MFLGRIHQQRGFLAEQNLLDLDEAEQAALVNLARIDLVNLTLIDEGDAVCALFGGHDHAESAELKRTGMLAHPRRRPAFTRGLS